MSPRLSRKRGRCDHLALIPFEAVQTLALKPVLIRHAFLDPRNTGCSVLAVVSYAARERFRAVFASIIRDTIICSDALAVVVVDGVHTRGSVFTRIQFLALVDILLAPVATVTQCTLTRVSVDFVHTRPTVVARTRFTLVNVHITEQS